MMFINDVLDDIDVNKDIKHTDEHDDDIDACKTHILEVEKLNRHVN